MDDSAAPAKPSSASEPFASAESARLDELRLAALEGRLEADLRLGRGGDLVGEFESLVGRYPLREGLRRQHMLALYRSGRQAEALAAYQDARRVLADELGIEPSPALRELERQILQQDASLDAPTAARAAASGAAANDVPPRATTGAEPRAPAEERKLATVLFADLVDATALASGQDPERTRALLDRFYDAMAEEIEAAGGTVEKFVGDAVMAAFGAPAAQEDHAERALHAALSMRRRLAELFGEALEVRIGVNTGEVVVGRSRAGSSFVTGDSVNVAARLEEAADPGEILVGERTVAAVGGAFDFSDARVVEAKGKPEGVRCRSLAGSLTRIPDSVQALLAARIDALEPGEKAALHAASVIGRVFWAAPVRELLGGAQPDWAMLEERDFVRRRSGSSIGGEADYAFKHALTREVAYASLLKARRARLHAGFAAWLEDYGDGRDDLAPLLGHHYAEAARPEDADLAWAGEEEKLEPLREKAVHWLRRAAELAIGRYDLDEGLRFLARAVELTTDADLRSQLWREIGLAHVLKYDGEAFVTAMQRSLELCTDRTTRGAGYALLAYHTASRSGMWTKGVDAVAVDEWVERAVELSPPESAARAQALAARAFLRPAQGAEAAREASAIADRAGDVELRSYAWASRAAVAFEQLEFDDSAALARQRFDLLPEISDPDHILGVYEAAIPALAGVGELEEAAQVASAHLALSRTLTPHHRIHGVGLTLEIQELTGDWKAVRDSTAEVEEAVAANMATPCRRNPRNLLVCAAAHLEAGDDDEAARLERAADACGMEDSGSGLTGARLRLAILRGDLDAVERLLTPRTRFGCFFGPAAIAARLDGLAALRDQDRIEQEAPPLLRHGTYTEPFALRALAIVRDDETLIEQALARFAVLRLDWHAAQTLALSRPAGRL